jgi:hypothetical protein
MSCDCKWCKTHSEFDRVMKATPKELRPYFRDMYDHLIGLSLDLNYYEAILDGKWPNSKEILLEALAKVQSGCEAPTTEGTAK